MKNTEGQVPQTSKKTVKIGKILLIVVGIVFVVGSIAGILIYSPSGEIFQGKTIVSDHTLIDCDETKGLIEKLPESWWGIQDESCTCDISKTWRQNPDVPNQFCGENISCLRLEEYPEPCVCASGYELKDGQCVQSLKTVNLAPITLKPTGFTTTTNDTKAETVETDDTTEKSTIQKSYVDVSDRFGGTNTITKTITTPQCADSSMDANCICPDDTYFDSVNKECVDITCDFDKQRVVETYNHRTESYDHTSVAGRALIEDYYKEEGSYEQDCAADVAVEEAVIPEEETAPEEEVLEEEAVPEEAVLTCDRLFANLSEAFRALDCNTYESTMETLDDDECFGYCESKFYWTIMYISLRDSIAARLYYDDENCTSCIMYNALAGYAAKLMSSYSDFVDTDAQMLRELLESSLDYCEAPSSLQEFKDGLEFDDSMFFMYKPPQEKPKVAGIFRSFIPTAYAQSGEFSEDVDSVIGDVFNERFELPEPEAPPAPQCRSLEIVKPDAAVGDQPTILIPLSGYVNEELAIQVDTDPDAVSLYRYKSLEATITFDNQGHIYDTIKTSVIMNHTDTSKGDIVTVWDLDNEGAGIQECHDSFVVQINTPEPPPASAAPPATTYVPPTPAPPPPPITSEQQFQQVAVPQPPPTPAVHAAAIPRSPENGPGMLLYLAGAGIGGVLLRHRKRK